MGGELKVAERVSFRAKVIKAKKGIAGGLVGCKGRQKTQEIIATREERIKYLNERCGIKNPTDKQISDVIAEKVVMVRLGESDFPSDVPKCPKGPDECCGKTAVNSDDKKIDTSKVKEKDKPNEKDTQKKIKKAEKGKEEKPAKPAVKSFSFNEEKEEISFEITGLPKSTDDYKPEVTVEGKDIYFKIKGDPNTPSKYFGKIRSAKPGEKKIIIKVNDEKVEEKNITIKKEKHFDDINIKI